MEDLPTLGEAVLHEVAQTFALGTVHHVVFLSEGRVNHNFAVVTGTGRYVVRRSRNERSAASIAFEHDLMHYLAQHAFPVPPLVPTVHGASFACIDDRLFRVTRFVPGATYTPGSEVHLRAVARTLAHYHHLIKEYPVPPQKEGFQPVLHTLAEGRQRLPQNEAAFAAALPDARPAVLDCLSYLREELERTHTHLTDHAAPATTHVVVHGSCRIGSFLFNDGHVAAMLDYDNAYVDDPTLDLAIGLLSFALVRPDQTSLDLAAARTFLAAYHKAAPGSDDMIALVPWYIRARILKRELSRYNEYVHNPKPGRAVKFAQAAAILRWLHTHEAQLLDPLHHHNVP